jgi:hypothetical protein
MNRDKSGKYSHSDMEKMCVCGHKLGRHTGEYPHDCCYGDGDDYDQKCECNGFKLKRRTA